MDRVRAARNNRRLSRFSRKARVSGLAAAPPGGDPDDAT
jgi:hypothetical protein